MNTPNPIRPTARLAALCLGSLLWCAPASAAGLEVRPVTLPNGLRVVLAPDPAALTVDAALWLPAGRRHERPGQAGLSLLAARLGFRNGAGEPLAPLAAVGGSGGVVVTPDYTSLSATVPGGSLELALGFLAERLPGRPVTAAALAAERAALRAEAARGERTAVARGLASLWAAAWPGHPYELTGAPPAAGSDALRPADVDAWKRARFTPGAALLTVTGAFEPESALALVRARFARLPRGGAPGATAARAPAAVRRGLERHESPARLCLVGWRGPGAGDPDAPALELLAGWLGGGPSARLPAALVREWQLALAAQAGFAAQKDGSLLWTLAVVPPGADSVAVEKTLVDAASTALQRDLEAFELERARRQVGSGSAFALQMSRQRGQALGEAELLAGDAGRAAARWETLAKVTPADVRRAATRVMTEAGRATVWVVPSGAGGGR
jgi:predicted Zn-dependent peptidase